MPRLARVVVPDMPHHVTQRGNRRQPVFFQDDDYLAYLGLLQEWCNKKRVEVWGYCLMPNHVHLLLVPASQASLRQALGEAHRRYTRRVNFREGWRGHLWQGRFASFVMDEAHLLAAARYVELNPVRAGLVARPSQWRWSSVHAHLAGKDDALVKVSPLLELAGNWKGLLKVDPSAEELAMLRRHERTGRPLGPPAFLRRLEKRLHRVLVPGKPGPKPRNRRS